MFAVLWPVEKIGEKCAAPEPTFAVEFRDAPWKDVLAWYGKISGLTFISAIRPPDTCTLTPGKDKKFTLTEVTDLLAEALRPHTLFFLRRETCFFIWPTDGSIDSYFFHASRSRSCRSAASSNTYRYSSRCRRWCRLRIEPTR